jgi:nicotinamide mononucleotide transporter
MNTIVLYLQTHTLEVFAVLTSLACVWFNVKQNLLTWIFAIISSALTARIFFEIHYWGDMYLQLFFIAMAFYGFYEWKYKTNFKKNNALEDPKHQNLSKHLNNPIKKLTIKATFLLILLHLVMTVGLFFFLKLFNTDVFKLDVLLTTGSIIATGLAIKKYLENWLVWVFLDVIYVGIFFEKKQELMACLYIFFVGMAIWGYLEWRKRFNISS